MGYNFYSKALDGTITPETMDYIVDKHQGYDNIHFNDDSGPASTAQLANINISGVDQSNSNDRVLYFSLVAETGSDTSVYIFKDETKLNLVASHTISGGTSGTTLALVEENSSGLSGTLDINYSTDDTDIYLEWGDGSDDAPYKTINIATTIASATNKIGIASGYYTGNRALKELYFYGLGKCVISRTNFHGASANTNSKYYNIDFALSPLTSGYQGKFYNCIFRNYGANFSGGGNASTAHIMENCIFIETVLYAYINSTFKLNKCVLYQVRTTGNVLFDLLKNCIIYNSPNMNLYIGRLNASYNCVYGNIKYDGSTIDYTGLPGTGHIGDDPLFNNPSLNDFTLQPTSPCIGAGPIEGNVKLNIGAKPMTKAITASDLFNNADSAINCELDADVIKINQHDKQVSGYNNGDFTKVYLHSSASAVDDYYNNLKIVFTSGTGVDENALITDYNGSSKIATIDTAITQDFDSFYSIEMFLESGDINIGQNYLSSYINLLSNFTGNTIYDTDHTNVDSDIYIKWADTEGGLSGATYELMGLNNPMLFDSSNSAGNADDNYVTGDEFQFIWFKVKLKAYIKV